MKLLTKLLANHRLASSVYISVNFPEAKRFTWKQIDTISIKTTKKISINIYSNKNQILFLLPCNISQRHWQLIGKILFNSTENEFLVFIFVSAGVFILYRIFAYNTLTYINKWDLKGIRSNEKLQISNTYAMFIFVHR